MGARICSATAVVIAIFVGCHMPSEAQPAPAVAEQQACTEAQVRAAKRIHPAYGPAIEECEKAQAKANEARAKAQEQRRVAEADARKADSEKVQALDAMKAAEEPQRAAERAGDKDKADKAKADAVAAKGRADLAEKTLADAADRKDKAEKAALRADQDEIAVALVFGTIFADMRGDKVDCDRAEQVLGAAAARSDVAAVPLGRLYLGDCPQKRDVRKAFDLFSKAYAKNKSPRAALQIALILEVGDGMELKANRARAIELYKEAAQAGLTSASTNLGILEWEKEKKPTAVALGHFRTALRKSEAKDAPPPDPRAGYYMAIAYEQGLLGARPNLKLAEDCLQWAAARNDAFAQARLARLLRDGGARVQPAPLQSLIWANIAVVGLPDLDREAKLHKVRETLKEFIKQGSAALSADERAAIGKAVDAWQVQEIGECK